MLLLAIEFMHVEHKVTSSNSVYDKQFAEYSVLILEIMAEMMNA